MNKRVNEWIDWHLYYNTFFQNVLTFQFSLTDSKHSSAFGLDSHSLPRGASAGTWAGFCPGLSQRADPLCRSKCTTSIGLCIVLSEVRLRSFTRDILNVISNKSDSTPMSERWSSGSSWWEFPFYSPFPRLLPIPELILLPAVPAQDHFPWKLPFCRSPPIKTRTVYFSDRLHPCVDAVLSVSVIDWPSHTVQSARCRGK